MSVLLAACLIVSLHDGDTLTVQCPQRVHPIIIRVAEIDAPELRAFTWGEQPGARDSLAEAQKTCPVQTKADVRLNKYDGRTKRWIAHVNCAGVDLSTDLASKGLAWAYMADKKSVIPSLMNQAQTTHIGLWAPGLPGGDPVAPSFWRAHSMHIQPGPVGLKPTVGTVIHGQRLTV